MAHKHRLADYSASECEPPMKKFKYDEQTFYAVAIGRTPGIYLQWSDFNKSTEFYEGARYVGCCTLQDATQFLNKNGRPHTLIDVHTGDRVVPLNEYCMLISMAVPMEVEYERETLFKLGSGLRLEATRFNREPRVDVRVWDDERRTKKGISLQGEQWLNLLSLVDDVEKDITQMGDGQNVNRSYHLGSNTFLDIRSPYKVMHIRRLYMHDGILKPGRQGIVLRVVEWRHLVHMQYHVRLALPELCQDGLDE